jgi:hypothetical protein
MQADPRHENASLDTGRLLLRVAIPLLVFPVLLLVFITFIEAPLWLFLTVAPQGKTWVSALSYAWFIVWCPFALWGAFKLCRQLWVRL